jgi:hypothetical protein
MKIDKIYINEAKRIRKIYFTNLICIVEKENDIRQYFSMIEKIKEDVDANDDQNDEFYVNKLIEINDNIESIKKFILPHSEIIKELDNAQKLLYNNIKDKYPNITDDEIQEQIIPYILPIDEEFRKKNKNLFNKIKERDDI